MLGWILEVHLFALKVTFTLRSYQRDTFSISEHIWYTSCIYLVYLTNIYKTYKIQFDLMLQQLKLLKHKEIIYARCWARWRPSGWTVDMWSLAKWWMVWMLCNRRTCHGIVQRFLLRLELWVGIERLAYVITKITDSDCPHNLEHLHVTSDMYCLVIIHHYPDSMWNQVSLTQPRTWSKVEAVGSQSGAPSKKAWLVGTFFGPDRTDLTCWSIFWNGRWVEAWVMIFDVSVS